MVFAPVSGPEVSLSWRDLDRRANQAASLLVELGAGPGDLVAVGLPNSVEHLVSTFGAWKIGASVLPVRSDMPAWERERLLQTVAPRLVIGDWNDGVQADLGRADIEASRSRSDAPPEKDVAPSLSRLLPTSGSTGTPKIIARPSPGLYAPDDAARAVVASTSSVTLCASPLYHNNGFQFCYPLLLDGDRVVLMEHFDAARAVDLVERYRVTMTVLVPTMLQRIARLEAVADRDFSSLERVIYGGASLPEWVARTWLELVPPERFVFVYGGSELLGTTMCTGREWLERPGTVGLPVQCDILILDADRRALPAGDVGEIWMRLHSDEQPFEYIGMPTPEPILGGYRTFGDMGWLDDDGYLYIADRRRDMIITGGANVFPAEVEAALSEHPHVADVVVIGLPDEEWGHRVHAIVQPTHVSPGVSEADLREFVRSRLSGPKRPKSFEFVEHLPRTSAGKINRSRLVEERTGGAVRERVGPRNHTRPLPPAGSSPLVALLDLEPAGEDTWTGHTPIGSARADIFGGQVAGQALRAATLTLSGTYVPNSLHCYFLRRGRSSEPVEIVVRRVRDGRTYASRQVDVRQDGKSIFSMMASFHVPEPGRERECRMPDGVPDPEDLEPEAPPAWDPLIEVRPVDHADGSLRWWGRAAAPFPADPLLHCCGLLYASDLRAGSVALAVAGFGDGLSVVRDAEGRPVGDFGSLDHALWFHRTPVVDDWFFCEVRPSTIRDSRGLVTGDMFDRAGRHLATFVQEMFLKEHAPPPFVQSRTGK